MTKKKCNTKKLANKISVTPNQVMSDCLVTMTDLNYIKESNCS